MKLRLLGLGAGLALVAILAPQASAQIAQGSTFNISVKADADSNNGPFATGSATDSQGGTINPFGGSVTVTDLNPAGGGPLTARSEAAATWVNTGQGSVTITDTGWNFATTAVSNSLINTAFSGLDVWTYTFLATSDGTFDMNYDVVGTGNTFGLQGAIIHWSGPGGDLDLTDPFDPAANGIFSRSLVNGQSYTVGIGTYSNIFAQGGIDLVGSFEARVDWKVNPVPEPFSIAGLILGVSVILRKKRTA